MKLSKKRIALAVGAAASIGAAATMASGLTFGLYSASEASTGNSFTSGTVSVGTGTPTSVTCTITNMVPGDSSVSRPGRLQGRHHLHLQRQVHRQRERLARCRRRRHQRLHLSV